MHPAGATQRNNNNDRHAGTMDAERTRSPSRLLASTAIAVALLSTVLAQDKKTHGEFFVVALIARTV